MGHTKYEDNTNVIDVDGGYTNPLIQFTGSAKMKRLARDMKLKQYIADALDRVVDTLPELIAIGVQPLDTQVIIHNGSRFHVRSITYRVEDGITMIDRYILVKEIVAE